MKKLFPCHAELVSASPAPSNIIFFVLLGAFVPKTKAFKNPYFLLIKDVDPVLEKSLWQEIPKQVRHDRRAVL